MSYNPPPKHFVNEQPAPITSALSVQIDNSTDEFTPGSTRSIFVNARIRSVSSQTQNQTQQQQQQRPPLHLTVCQDVSGSLAGEKLTMCKHALNFVVDKLSATDRFGLVTFGSRVREIVPLIEMTDASHERQKMADQQQQRSATRFGGSVSALSSSGGSNLASMISGKESAKRSIYEIEAGGNTALAGGLLAALKQEPFIVPSSGASSWASNTVTAVVSHTMQRKVMENSRKFMGWYYKITITPPGSYSSSFASPIKSMTPSPNVVECTHFEVSAGGLGDSAITASGETEFELPPLTEPLEKIKITFFMSNDTRHTVECPIGDTLMKKQHLPLNNSNMSSKNADDGGDHAESSIAGNLRPVRAILLFTDGNMNTGNVNSQSLKRDVQHVLDTHQRTKGTRPLLFTFGFGNETNASLLKDLAQLTQSSFYHMTNASHVPRVFADVLGSLFSIVSQNVKLFVRPNLQYGVTIGRILCGGFKTSRVAQETLPVADNNDDDQQEQQKVSRKTDLRSRGDILSIASGHQPCHEINIGNIFRDEPKDVLIECVFSDDFGDTKLPLSQKYPDLFAPVEFTLQYRGALSTSESSSSNNVKTSVHSSALVVMRNENATAASATTTSKQKRNDLVDSVYHRFRTQETLQEVREMADRGAMKEAHEHAVQICKRLEEVLSDIRASERLAKENGSASSTVNGNNNKQNQSRETVEKCLSQVNHIALTAVTDALQYTVSGGAQTVNSYENELAVQRNNNSYGTGSGDVGERARSLFDINEMRKHMREEVAMRFP